ncbi:MAG TPA: protoporphyrinogen oxidase [Herpetosiphonaceae bacterium]|nr:protoporphyrinogen oxidase [Herpetosiphonaceae bacterium]
MENAPHIVIIGGGIAGLSTAWYMQKAAQAQNTPVRVTLIERDSRLGGKLLTETVRLPESAEPLLVEGGPDAFISQKPWGLQLARELGLEDQLISTQPARHKVYVLHRNQPEPLPDGVNLVVPTQIGPFLRSPIMSWRGKLRMLLDLVLPARRSGGDEALADFVKRRFGAEALDKIAEPLMAGIHNAESDRQSLAATFPRFRDVEQKHGSLIRGMRAARKNVPANQTMSPFVSLKGGIGALVARLAERLECDLRVGRGVASLEHRPGEPAPYRVGLDDGSQIDAAAVVLAVPSFIAADLLEPWAGQLSAGLRQIRYVSTGTVTLAFRRSEAGLPLDSYGLVIPNSERRRINAVTILSRKWAGRAPDEYVLMRAFVGGSKNPAALRLSDDELVELVRDEFRIIFGVDAAPAWSGVYRWPLANPQYDVGHLERVDALEARCPQGLYLCGSAYRGVGIPDCARQGQETAARVMNQLSLDAARDPLVSVETVAAV